MQIRPVFVFFKLKGEVQRETEVRLDFVEQKFPQDLYQPANMSLVQRDARVAQKWRKSGVNVARMCCKCGVNRGG